MTHRVDRSGWTFAHLLHISDGEWEELRHGGYLYRRCRKWGAGVRVYYDGIVEGMGSYCQISGDGCRELERTGKLRDWQEFAIQCVEVYHVKCVRLDVFKDDRQGLLDMDELERKLADGECTKHVRDYIRLGKKVIGGRGKRVGDTINIGSRKSDSFVRIYDKTLESRPEGRKTEDWQVEHGHHVRVELELKRKRAQAAMVRLAQTGFGEGLIAGLIRGVIDFKEADARGHNGRRVPTWGAWLAFVESEAKVKLDVGYEQSSLDKALYYHRKQYGPTLAAAFMRLGGDVEEMARFVVRVAVDGKTRMGRKHYRLLEDARGEVIAA